MVRVQRGALQTPAYGNAEGSTGEAANEVGVVHPCLYDIRTIALEQVPQPKKPTHSANSSQHVETLDRNTQGRDSLADRPVAAEAVHERPIPLAVDGAEDAI
jgi:hypothetical protein